MYGIAHTSMKLQNMGVTRSFIIKTTQMTTGLRPNLKVKLQNMHHIIISIHGFPAPPRVLRESDRALRCGCGRVINQL